MDTKIVVAIMALVVLGGAFYFGSNWWELRNNAEAPQVVSSDVSVETLAEGGGIAPEGESLGPVNSPAPLSNYDKVAQLLTGKWRNEASQNQIFKVSADHSFEESYLTENGEFMVPKATWSLEKTAVGDISFDPRAPLGALVFVRTSEKGESRRYEIRSLTDSKVELFDLNRKTIVTWLRIVSTP